MTASSTPWTSKHPGTRATQYHVSYPAEAVMIALLVCVFCQVCRRAERSVVALVRSELVDHEVC